MRVGDNPSLSISRQLAQSQARISRALGRLSSGLRLNRFGEDSASFSTSVRLGSQLRGMAQLAQGWNQARGLLETSSAAIGSQTEIVQRMREIAVQASSSLLGSAERVSLNQELLSLREEFARITQTTEFAGMKLLNGSMDSFSILTSSGASSLSLELPTSSLDQVFQKTLGTGAFSFTASFDVGVAPRNVVTADLNGNGLLDIITTNLSNDSISVQLAQGDGNFGPAQAFEVGDGPNSIALGDFDGDGLVDVVVTNVNDGSVSVLLGKGDGTFAPQMSFQVGANASGVSVGDLNGNGILDLVTIDPGDGTLSILLGKGDGSFQERVTVLANDSPNTIQLADLNGNGHLDVLTGSIFTPQLRIYYGNGEGSFSAPVTLASGAGVTSIQAADLNGNGILDLVSLDNFDNTLSVYLGLGGGNYAARVTYATGASGISLIAQDLTGNGVLDLGLVNTADSQISILLGNGDGSFQDRKTSAVEGVVTFLHAADLNGDGVAEILVANASGNNVGLLESVTKKVSAIPDLQVNSPEEAQELIKILDQSLDTLSRSQSKLAGQLLRLDSLERNTSLQAESLQGAIDQLTQADFAMETAELVAAQILQQVQIASLVQANTQMQVILELLRL